MVQVPRLLSSSRKIAWNIDYADEAKLNELAHHYQVPWYQVPGTSKTATETDYISFLCLSDKRKHNVLVTK